MNRRPALTMKTSPPTRFRIPSATCDRRSRLRSTPVMPTNFPSRTIGKVCETISSPSYRYGSVSVAAAFPVCANPVFGPR